MKKPKEQRIYVVVAKTIDTIKGKVTQPLGRQAAQACHVVSKLRNTMSSMVIGFEPITTIILQARDSAELQHVQLLALKKKLRVVSFFDTNPEYGDGEHKTAIAFLATQEQTHLVCDYLPLWGAK